MYLTVIIPAYNEEKNMADTLSEIEGYLSGKDFSSEVIVADDGSMDSTVLEAREFEGRIKRLRVIESKPNRGKGYVVKKAMLEAQGDYVLFMDADNSTSIKELEKFFPELGDKHSIYIASRRMSGSDVKVPVT